MLLTDLEAPRTTTRRRTTGGRPAASPSDARSKRVTRGGSLRFLASVDGSPVPRKIEPTHPCRAGLCDL